MFSYHMRCRPSPLVIYAFTKNEESRRKREHLSLLAVAHGSNQDLTVVERTDSGSLILNDTFMQLIGKLLQ